MRGLTVTVFGDISDEQYGALVREVVHGVACVQLVGRAILTVDGEFAAAQLDSVCRCTVTRSVRPGQWADSERHGQVD